MSMQAWNDVFVAMTTIVQRKYHIASPETPPITQQPSQIPHSLFIITNYLLVRYHKASSVFTTG